MDEGIHQKLTEFLTECIKRKDGEGGEPKLACCSQILPLRFKPARKMSHLFGLVQFLTVTSWEITRDLGLRENISPLNLSRTTKNFILYSWNAGKNMSNQPSREFVTELKLWLATRLTISSLDFSSVFRSKSEIHWNKSQVFHQECSKKALWKNTKRRRTVSKELYTKQPITGLFFPWSTIDPDFVFTTFLSRPSLYYIWCHWGPLLEI